MSEPSLRETEIQEMRKEKKATGAAAGSSRQKSKKSKKKPSDKASGIGKRRKTSSAWDHFTEIPDTKHATCNYCGSKIGCDPKKGTGALLRHNERCKMSPENIDRKQKMIQLDEKSVVGVDGVVSSYSVPSLWNFDHDVCRKALARMIIIDELPFSFVELEGFRYLCKSLNPAFSIPSRPTITRDCYSLYIEEKKKLKSMIGKMSSRVSLTTDAWTSGQNLSYMCLTMHFIDDD